MRWSPKRSLMPEQSAPDSRGAAKDTVPRIVLRVLDSFARDCSKRLERVAIGGVEHRNLLELSSRIAAYWLRPIISAYWAGRGDMMRRRGITFKFLINCVVL